MRIILTVVLFVATSALAQQSLKIKEPVGSQLSPGSVQSYPIELKSVDYVAGLLDQHGSTDLTILASDSSPVRHYPGQAEDGKSLWVFIADTPGVYKRTAIMNPRPRRVCIQFYSVASAGFVGPYKARPSHPD